MAKFEKLENSKYVKLQSDFFCSECFFSPPLFCCEKENQFTLIECTDNTFVEEKHNIGTWQESSSACCRTICCSARTFEGEFKMRGISIGKGYYNYGCKCCCNLMSWPCLKPSITVEGHNNDIVGRLELKYYGPFCGLNRCSITEIQVFDKLQRHIYTISCNCCQKPVIWLPC